MKELITLEQANHLMLALLLILPLLGAVAGWSLKQTRAGFVWGVAAGIVNLILWHVYNALTDRMGLDTVKNLLVNLALFTVIGVVIGSITGAAGRRRNRPDSGGGRPGGGEPALAGGPAGRSSRGNRTFEEAVEPPRDAG